MRRSADNTRLATKVTHTQHYGHATCPLCVAVAVKAPLRAVEPSMMMEESQVALSTLSSISETLAASSGDFGGMTVPIIGLGLLASIIALLAGPIED